MLDCIAYYTVVANPSQGLEKIIIGGKAMITGHNASIFLVRSEYVAREPGIERAIAFLPY